MWKAYSIISAVLFATILFYRPTTTLDWLDAGVAAVSLVGVFGYAWTTKVPRWALLWRAVGFLCVGLIIVDVWLLWSADAPAWSATTIAARVLATAIVMLITVPTPVALIRLATRVTAVRALKS